MIKLKKIISQLNESLYRKLENDLIRNRGDNFLFLLKAYRNDTNTDDEIAGQLKLNGNAFYVLKSRLHDKIQEYLSGDIHASKEEVTRQLHRIPEMCYSTPREVAHAYLLKLEKDLLVYDMHNELLVVYSALKQIHLYSEKYFHYSQLFNKHIAFSLSIEKSQEILGNFNRVLAEYNFSRSPRLLEKLIFLNKGISDHYNLHPSRQIAIIRNIIDLQLDIFCHVRNRELSTENLLLQTTTLIAELPDSSQLKIWSKAMDFLYFEYYHSTGQTSQSRICYRKVEENLHNILLYSGVCLTSIFLVSRICFLQEENRTGDLQTIGENEILKDPDDFHAKVLLAIHNAMAHYYAANLKEAVATLNQLLNDHSFKDLQHIITEIKLCLAWFYILLEEHNLATQLLKNLQRRIRSEEGYQYTNAIYLIKIFISEIKSPSQPPGRKEKDNFDLFMARNKKEHKMLHFLEYELSKKFKSPINQ
jgi:hypothetical protein